MGDSKGCQLFKRHFGGCRSGRFDMLFERAAEFVTAAAVLVERFRFIASGHRPTANISVEIVPRAGHHSVGIEALEHEFLRQRRLVHREDRERKERQREQKCGDVTTVKVHLRVKLHLDAAQFVRGGLKQATNDPENEPEREEIEVKRT